MSLIVGRRYVYIMCVFATAISMSIKQKSHANIFNGESVTEQSEQLHYI